MGAAFVASGTLTNASASPLTLPLYAGNALNDLILFLSFVRSVGTEATAGGFDAIIGDTSTTVRKYASGKIHTGSESNPSAVATSFDSTHRGWGLTVGVRGAINTSVANAIENSAVTSASSATISLPAVNIATSNCLVVAGFLIQSTSSSVDWAGIGYTQIDYLSTSTGNATSVSWGYFNQGAASNLSATAISLGGLSSASWSSQIIVVKPEGGLILPGMRGGLNHMGGNFAG
jgi:hypothetical protein